MCYGKTLSLFYIGILDRKLVENVEFCLTNKGWYSR